MSRVNHNASYINEVDGETVWERLRNIRNFLIDRRKALKIAEYDLAKADKLDKDSDDYFYHMVERDHIVEMIGECKSEIEFLEEFERRLAAEAEKTRIPGKTDDEMYEINFFDESRIRLVRSVQAEIASCGVVTVPTMKALLRNPRALETCVEIGYLNENIICDNARVAKHLATDLQETVLIGYDQTSTQLIESQ